MPIPLGEKKLQGSKMLPVTLTSCQSLIVAHHYSKRIPANVQLCFADIVYGPPKVVLACCTFSVPPSRWSETLWELSRLVRLPTYEKPLTKLISKAVGFIRANKLIDLLISFADSEEDHHGGIYQACSWLYDGMRGERLDGFNIDGEFVPARSCNSVYGTSSEEMLQKRLHESVIVPHYDDGKHCYWKAVSKDGMRKANRLNLRSCAYPKPMILDGTISNTKKMPGHINKGIVDVRAITKNISKDQVEESQQESLDVFSAGRSLD